MPEGSEQEAMCRRLQRLERLLACFQQALGHELPNQLVAIGGLLRLLELEEGQRLGADGRDYLGRLNAAVQKLNLLSTGLADLARTARPQDRPGGAARRNGGSVGQVAEEAVAEVKQLFPDRAIEYDISPAACTLTVPRPELRTVLLQLLLDAVQRSGGDRPLRLRIDACRRESAVELCLADDGPEVPAGRQAHLFDPFAAAGAPGTAAPNLGLFLVQQIVDGWAGGISLSSAPGQGCAFTIRIPSTEIAASGR
jgi:two-component system OmpR family sensor kinase